MSVLDMLNDMAIIPNLYFGDLWQDAQMANLLKYVLDRGGRGRSNRWTPEAERVIELIPWEKLEFESLWDECVHVDFAS